VGVRQKYCQLLRFDRLVSNDSPNLHKSLPATREAPTGPSAVWSEGLLRKGASCETPPPTYFWLPDESHGRETVASKVDASGLARTWDKSGSEKPV
jgi:hypothetical protein